MPQTPVSHPSAQKTRAGDPVSKHHHATAYVTETVPVFS
jgi:hypothetical protein